MYVLIDIKGKQYKAEKGIALRVDKIESEKGKSLEFDKVLMLRNDDDLRIGAPYLDGISIKATVEDQIRDKKLIVFKYKKRKNYRRTRGHRQSYTIVRIDEIVGA